MKMLVTGSSGFIGRNFLLKSGCDAEIIGTYLHSADFPRFVREMGIEGVKAVRCDLTDPNDVRNLARREGTDFDLILHLLGSTDPRESVTNPLHDMKHNVTSLLNLLNTFSCGKLVFFSSGAVYDGNRGLVSPRTAISPTLPYAISKMAAESYVRFFKHVKENIGSYVILRFFGAYGPFEPPRKIYTRLVKAFAIDGMREFEVSGNGKNLIDAMYIDDAINGLDKVIRKKTGGSLTIDFGTGNPITIDDLVRVSARTFGIDDVVIRHAGSTAEYISFRISNAQMKRLFLLRA